MNTIPIPSSDLKKSFLLNEGVYAGDLFDFLKDEELWYLENIIRDVKNYAEENRDKLFCRYSYELINDDNVNENIGFQAMIPLENVANRDLFVLENKRKVSQKWFEFDGFNKKCDFFMELSNRILDFFYPNIEIDYNQTTHFSLFENGHFIKEHNDGENKGRVCALIIYLSDDEQYKDIGGGELVVTTNSNKVYEIKPIFGVYSLLDFTKNNIRHSVNEVKNGFKRYSFIYFFNEKPKEKTIKLI